ncbi:MAG: hypothetical protein Q8O83_01930 [bacterium]|nr:hypothetical protein [bacterium]
MSKIIVSPNNELKNSFFGTGSAYTKPKFVEGIELFAGESKPAKNVFVFEALSPVPPTLWEIFIDGDFYQGMSSEAEANKEAEWCDLYLRGELPSQRSKEERMALEAYMQAQTQRHQMY